MILQGVKSKKEGFSRKTTILWGLSAIYYRKIVEI